MDGAKAFYSFFPPGLGHIISSAQFHKLTFVSDALAHWAVSFSSVLPLWTFPLSHTERGILFPEHCFVFDPRTLALLSSSDVLICRVSPERSVHSLFLSHRCVSVSHIFPKMKRDVMLIVWNTETTLTSYTTCVLLLQHSLREPTIKQETFSTQLYYIALYFSSGQL